MILYNVTVSISPEVHEEWVSWMRNIHIKEVIDTACFTEARLSRVQGEEEGGFTYSIMYFSPSEDLYEKYKNEFAQSMQAKHNELFAGKFAAFRTVLNVIEQFKV